ncbi:MAG: hypothetical protein WDN10_02170 [bacterium]
MAYLIAILITVFLFLGFLALTGFERRRGFRYFERERAELDRFARRVEFIFEHVDFASFLRHLVVSTVETLAHEVVRLVLLGVRALERLLTRVVKHLRLRRAVPLEAAAAPASPFVATIATFKHRLRKERAENKAAAESAETDGETVSE